MEEEKTIIKPRAIPQDSYLSFINNMPMATHFYYMEFSLYGDNAKNLKPFSHSGLVLNLLYTPFLEKKDLMPNLFEIEYDQKNLGTVADTGHDFEPDVMVYKIRQGFVKDKKVGSFKKYPTIERSNKKSYLNESKLYQYPYYYLTINDYVNSPLFLNPQYLKRNVVNVNVSQPITVTGGYTIYVPEYKGDNNGVNEGLFSASGLDLPTSSTQYAQFMANSKSNFQTQLDISKRDSMFGLGNMFTNALQSGLTYGAMGAGAGSIIPGAGTVAGAMTGFFGGAAIEMIKSGLSLSRNEMNAVDTAQAQIEDIMRAPRNVSLPSTDVLMALDRNEGKLWCNSYTITDYYKQKLCDYWTLYGYKQNKLMYKEDNGLIKTRKYFNYIKTINANIRSSELDKTEIELIKEIYNKGVTFWHQRQMELDHVEMYDYSKDNKEIWDLT